MSDPLFEAIRQDPDDDAPRLVWADREGGERGELVVLQCMLARPNLPRADRHRLVRRERDLLTMYGSRWSKIHHTLGSPRFVRGFVERVAVDTAVFLERSSDIVARAPLLRDLELRAVRSEAWEKTVETLAGSPDERFGGVESLTLDHEATEPSLHSLARLPKLERLVLPAHDLGIHGCMRLLPILPSLKRLAFTLHPMSLELLLGAPELARVTELQLEPLLPHQIERLVEATSSLERLSLRGVRRHAIGVLAEARNLERLVDLELEGPIDDASLARLSSAPFAAGLRRLALNGARLTSAAISTLLSFPALERLSLRNETPMSPLSALESVIPDVHGG